MFTIKEYTLLDNNEDFKSFGLHENIVKAIEKVGYDKPTPVQQMAIPLIQEGKDLIALAQTGSGKTAACTIPICNRIDSARRVTQCLIIVPTRELCVQYATEAQKIGRYHGVKAFAMYGGEDGSLQEAKLSDGVHLLIATPGRLIDFIYSRRIDLTQVETLVLDEADEMLSMGFYDDLEFIIQCLIHDHQTLLFSATMPPKIRQLAKLHMKEPCEISLVSKEASPSNIKHQFVYCAPREREEKLIALLHELNPKQSIIFANSRIQCEKLQAILKRKEKSVDFLHGGLAQNLRTVITRKFRQHKIKHLVATDVAARGLDFSGVTHVFIFQLSDDVDTYLHRSGRTGRVDRSGVVTSFVSSREMGALNKVVERLKCKPIWIGKEPGQRGNAGHAPSEESASPAGEGRGNRGERGRERPFGGRPRERQGQGKREGEREGRRAAPARGYSQRDSSPGVRGERGQKRPDGEEPRERRPREWKPRESEGSRGEGGGERRRAAPARGYSQRDSSQRDSSQRDSSPGERGERGQKRPGGEEPRERRPREWKPREPQGSRGEAEREGRRAATPRGFSKRSSPPGERGERGRPRERGSGSGSYRENRPTEAER